MRSHASARIAAAATAALLLAACGGSPSSSGGSTDGSAAPAGPDAMETFERLNGLTGQEREDELVRCAEEEGQLSLYTSGTDHDDIISGFEDEYDITTSVYRGSGETVRQRLLQEQDAAFYGNDVVETDSTEINILAEEGFLAPYESELRDQVREEGQAENWTANRFNVLTVGWNTDKVKPGEEPTSYEELADPKWKGRISMELGDRDWFAALYLHFVDQGKSEEEVLQLFKDMAANSQIAKGHTAQVELLSAGQYDVVVSTYTHTIDKAADSGASVAWQPAQGEPIQPAVIQPNGIAPMKTATNPCAAVLYVDWNLTFGQEVFKEAFRVGATEEAAQAIADLDVIELPQDELTENGKKWDDLYAEVLQSAAE